jgi:ribonuclease-3
MTLEAILGFNPDNKKIYQQAVTHASADGLEHNERLEFLGDAAFGLFATQWLYERYQQADEGMLSRLRAQLCCQQAMVLYVNHLQISDLLIVKQQELREQPAVLADLFEAFCGALYLDKGYIFMREWLLQRCTSLFITRLSAHNLKDYKSQLQELMQQKSFPLPRYNLVATQGPANAPCFVVHAQAAGHITQGQGSTKRQAEQIAAQMMLNILQKENSHES